MIKSISFYDVLDIPRFEGLTQEDLLSLKMDKEVMPYLYRMGANIDTQVLIQACRHRCLDNSSVMGYRYCAMERTDKQWLDSRFGSMTARIHSQKDKELSSDMLKMSKEGMDWNSFKRMALMAASDKELELVRERRVVDDFVDTYEDDTAAMKALQKLQISIRGWLHPDEDMINPPKGIL